MAVPLYDTDLTDITLSESTTGYVAYGGGGAGLASGPDYSMQGTNCVEKQVTNAEKGILYDNGSGITMFPGDHLFAWVFVSTPGLTDTLAARGAVVGIGSSATAFCKYHVEGNDTYGAGGRVGKCYPIDQTVDTDNTGSAPYRTRVGTPSGTLQYFGAGLNTTASVKATNLGLDAIRYGTGIYITAGDSGTPGTFKGAATENDLVANRWGVLTDLGGSLELQGKFVVGQNDLGTATQAYFDAANTVLSLVDTPHSATDFTEILVDHASTVFNLTNITVLALGTNNPGKLTYNNASTVSALNTCTFDSIGTSVLRAGVTATDCTWRTTDLITLNSATLDGCLVSNSSASASVLASTLADLTNCNFESDGSNHAVELNSIGGGTMSWANNTTGYETGASGSPVTPTSTGNEDIYVNVGSGTLTINVAAGATTPSIRSAGATVNVVAGQITLTVKGVPTSAEWRLYEDSVTAGEIGTVAIDGAESHTGGDITYAYTYSSDQDVVLQVIADGFEEGLIYFTLGNADQTQTVNLETELNT